MQYGGMTLRCLKQCMHVFSLKIASFLRYYVCKKKIPMASYGDILFNGKQKKPFAKRWSHYNTVISQVNEALNGPDSNLFCPDLGPDTRLINLFFFFVLFLCMYFSQKPRYLFKKELHIEQKSANRFIFVSL